MQFYLTDFNADFWTAVRAKSVATRLSLYMQIIIIISF